MAFGKKRAGGKHLVPVDEVQAAGSREVVRGGRDDRGEAVSIGVYFYVLELVDGAREPGVCSVSWTADGIASGVYFARLRAGKTEVSRKMSILQVGPERVAPAADVCYNIPPMAALPIVYIRDLRAHAGKEVELRGWVYNTRSGGKIRFLILRDGTGYLQCVAGATDISPEEFELLGHIDQESSVIVTGVPREDRRAPGGVELTLKSLKLVGGAENYPITPKEHSSSFLLDHRHLWLRSRKQHVVLKVRHHTVAAIRDYLNSHGFINLDTPIFTPNACEGTSTLFETDYFGDKAYLSQSGQLYNEATVAAFGKVYCFGPTFRAEKSKTRRHLTEFWMVEPEVAYMELPGLMNLCEDFFCYIVARVLETCGGELKGILERDTSRLEAVKKPFKRLHYKEAARFLLEKGLPFDVGGDFGAPDETALTENETSPIFVHHFPTAIKAFYMEPDPQEPEYCLSCDMLAPEGYGEVIGGSQRIWKLELLEQRIKEHNLPRSAFEWYLDLRKFGSVPHSGFGMGVERTVSYLCGLQHLREAIPFPRMLNRLNP